MIASCSGPITLPARAKPASVITSDAVIRPSCPAAPIFLETSSFEADFRGAFHRIRCGPLAAVVEKQVAGPPAKAENV